MMFRRFSTLCIIVILVSLMLPKLTVEAQTGANLALNKPTTSSSNENAGTTPNLAVDGNLGTRWSSAFSDPQWVQIDLGATTSVNHVKLTWEAAYGKSYQIQVSNDATNWTTLYSTTTGDGGVDDLTGLSGSGRYIRMVGTVRATGYGYSLWEFEVYGPSVTPTNTSVPPTATNTATAVATSAGCGTTNVALNKPATSSSNENAGTTPNLAVDGNLGTRWSSAASDPQWIQIDLGSTQTICHVKLTWETAYGKSYQIQVSNDAANWTTIYSTTTGDGGVDDLTGLSGSGRYIRMVGTVRATGYGYSLWEFEVYAGSAAPTNTPVATNTATKVATFTPTATNTATATRTNTPVPPTATATSTTCGTTNIALNKPATSSSNENVGTTPNLAVDGNLGTRWSSAYSDPQWIQIDLGASYTICHVKLTWEAAYGKSYQIQVSADGTLWANLYSTTTGDGGVDDLTGLSGNGRYIRMYGTVRATGYGYSLWEFEVYAAGGSSTPVPSTNTPTPVPTFVPPSVTPVASNTPTPLPTSTGCPTTNFAINRPATASSVNGTNTAALAVDGLSGTRWESAASDPQWIQLDFGTSATFCRVVLNWEVAAASAYQLQTSNDGANWTPIYSTTTSTGGLQDLTVSGSGRYLRMIGTARTTTYGYSLWEFEVHGTGGTTLPTPTPIPTLQSGPVDFGPNVTIFDPSMSTATVQDRLNTIFNIQQTNQFGTDRFALLFKPGTYAVDANIGFYTQIAGLGLSPNDVTINHVTSDAQWFGGNATQNFWRMAENMRVTPSDGTNIWAVSQAAPFRRMNVQGQLKLDPTGNGWSSGGFIADTLVTGQAASGSQQQYFTRNSEIGSWSNCVWNCVFVGVNGAPAQAFPNPPYTTVAQAPVISEKPFLYVDGSGNYFVFVPALRTNTSGTTWNGKTPAGTSLPISQFYIVKPGATATAINNALAAGQNLVVTPGVYHLDQTLNVTRANTVVLGLGLATFINDNGVVAMKIADVDGVKIAGILFDAGTANAPDLLEVGPAGASASHASNPTVLYDVFARVGGAVAGKVTNAVVVNSSNVIIDDTWLWRADHGSGIGWTVNTANTGLIVNGANVTTYGLFVEHFQQYNVIWNANGGRDYFFQNELPYDPPNQAAYMNGATRGYAAYKVANNVTSHEAWGVGSYCYFNVDPTIVNDHSFEAPNTPGVLFHDLLTVSLGNNGIILHVINNTGAQTPTNTTPSTVVSFP